MSMQNISRPSLSPMRQRSQATTTLPLNDPLLVKRRKVIMEFYETEKVYVEGLDLIYKVNDIHLTGILNDIVYSISSFPFSTLLKRPHQFWRDRC